MTLSKQSGLRGRDLSGGWAQLPTLESDAYATGQVLVALHQAGGLSESDPAYSRGVRFLLKTLRILVVEQEGMGGPRVETFEGEAELRLERFAAFSQTPGVLWVATLRLLALIRRISCAGKFYPRPRRLYGSLYIALLALFPMTRLATRLDSYAVRA